MLINIPHVLQDDTARACRKAIEAAQWLDGRTSAGSGAERVKSNDAASFADPTVSQWSGEIRRILMANQNFIARALPARICPPSFNRFGAGQAYGEHNDSALINFSKTVDPLWVRNDLAATLFLTPIDDYEGGELIIEDTFGPAKVKLPAGDMILYPAGSQHRVAPVTRGTRIASYFWVQSLIRDDAHRHVLHNLDVGLTQLREDFPEHQALPKLLGVYHNLLRLWADT